MAELLEFQMNLRMTNKLHESCTIIANKSGLTLAAWIRLAMEEKLAREGNPLANYGDREELEKMMMEIVQREMRKDRR